MRYARSGAIELAQAFRRVAAGESQLFTEVWHMHDGGPCLIEYRPLKDGPPMTPITCSACGDAVAPDDMRYSFVEEMPLLLDNT